MAILVPDETLTIPPGLRGRFIAEILINVIGFWLRHRSTLAPVIDARLTSILDSLADAILLVQQIVLPGPE